MMAGVMMEAGSPPVALDEVKALLRLDHSAEDALIAGFVRSATAMCEAFCGTILIEREASETVEARPGWRRLGVVPVTAIQSVAVPVGDGAEEPLAADAYAIDIDSAGDGWVRVTRRDEAKTVRVRFRAGLAADWNGVPEPLRQGIVRLAAHLYGARGEGEAAPPASIAALWRPWRRLRLA
jgi:uncharacterized phiE125 gp8 family phage protein